MKRTKRTLMERFSSKFTPEPNTGCWLWTGAASPTGYGHIGSGSRSTLSAHRASWILHFGDPGDMYVLHRCDTPQCVNPAHLWLGTASENTHDMVAKKRAVAPRLPGDLNPNAKLNSQQVLTMRAMHAEGGWTFVALAKEFGVSASQAGRVVGRGKWAHI